MGYSNLSRLLLRELRYRVGSQHMCTIAAEQKQRPEICPYIKESQQPLNGKPFESIPGPRILPVIGSLWQYFPMGRFHNMDEAEVLGHLHSTYGSVIKERFAQMTLVRLFDPVDFSTVYFSDLKCPQRPGMGMMWHYNQMYNNKKQGLLTGEGENWSNLRKQVQHHFMPPSTVASYIPAQDKVAHIMVQRLSGILDSNGEIQDLMPELYRFAIESMVSLCFGMQLGALEENKAETDDFFEAVNIVMRIMQDEIKSFPWYKIMNTPTMKTFVKCNDFIRRVSMAYSDAAMERSKGSTPGAVTALRVLLSLDEEEFAAFLGDMLFASIDTTGHSLAFALYQISKHPNVQEKLYQEIKDFGCENGTMDLRQMRYLRGVIKETMRLNPVLPSVGRILSSDIVVSGYRLEKGTMVSLHHGWAGKQEKYFENALEFVPERWLHNRSSTRHPYIFLPFGFGPRSCIGQRVAHQEISLALIRILQKYKVTYLFDNLETVTTIVTSPAHKLPFRFEERK